MRITKQVLRAGVVAVAALALTVATPAQAKGIAEARVVGNAVQYLAGPEDNRIVLSEIDGYFVIDDAVTILPGPGCYQAPGIDDTIVHCTTTRINRIHLDLGAGHDRGGSKQVAPTLKIPLLLLGGPGHDELYGERGDDKLDGGQDDNLVDGGAGIDSCVNGPVFQDCESVS